MEIAIAAVCVVVSALFSGTEVAMFALRRVDREQMSRSQRPADKRVLAMLRQPRRLLTTVLIANESINAVTTVLVLLVIATQLTSPWAVGGATLGVMVPVVVLFGEVTPKTLALKAPLAWARRSVAPLTLFYTLVAPVRWVIGGLVEMLLRPLGGARSAPVRDLSEEEFRILIDASSAQGQVDARERRLIHKVFEFSDKNVGQIMTPRDRVFALSYDLPTARLLKEVAARGFSRIPIYQKSLDNVRGILNAKDLLRPSAGQAGRTLGELLHEPLFVPRTTPIKRVFLTFKQRKVHMAIVVNEYGKMLGLVTMDDVLAQLFGTLRDEREGLQAAGRRGRGGRTPPGGVPIVEVPAAAGGPVGALGPIGAITALGGVESEPGAAAAGAAETVATEGEPKREDEADVAGGGLRGAETEGEEEAAQGSAAGGASASSPGLEALRARTSARFEIHEEVTPPAIDLSELTPPGLAAVIVDARDEAAFPERSPPLGSGDGNGKGGEGRGGAS